MKRTLEQQEVQLNPASIDQLMYQIHYLTAQISVINPSLNNLKMTYFALLQSLDSPPCQVNAYEDCFLGTLRQLITLQTQLISLYEQVNSHWQQMVIAQQGLVIQSMQPHNQLNLLMPTPFSSHPASLTNTNVSTRPIKKAKRKKNPITSQIGLFPVQTAREQSVPVVILVPPASPPRLPNEEKTPNLGAS